MSALFLTTVAAAATLGAVAGSPLRFHHVADLGASYVLTGETAPPPAPRRWSWRLLGHALPLWSARGTPLPAPLTFTVVGPGGTCVARAARRVLLGAGAGAGAGAGGGTDRDGRPERALVALALDGCPSDALGERIAVEGAHPELRWTPIELLPDDLPFWGGAPPPEPKTGPLAGARRWLRRWLATHPPARPPATEEPLTLSLALPPGLDVALVATVLVPPGAPDDAAFDWPGPWSLLRVVRAGEVLATFDDARPEAVLDAGAGRLLLVIARDTGMDLRVLEVTAAGVTPLLEPLVSP